MIADCRTPHSQFPFMTKTNISECVFNHATGCPDHGSTIVSCLVHAIPLCLFNRATGCPDHGSTCLLSGMLSRSPLQVSVHHTLVCYPALFVSIILHHTLYLAHHLMSQSARWPGGLMIVWMSPNVKCLWLIV